MLDTCSRSKTDALVSPLRDKCHCPVVFIRNPGQGKRPDADIQSIPPRDLKIP